MGLPVRVPEHVADAVWSIYRFDFKRRVLSWCDIETPRAGGSRVFEAYPARLMPWNRPRRRARQQ